MIKLLTFFLNYFHVIIFFMSTLIMKKCDLQFSKKFLLLIEKFLQQAMSENDEFANFSRQRQYFTFFNFNSSTNLLSLALASISRCLIAPMNLFTCKFFMFIHARDAACCVLKLCNKFKAELPLFLRFISLCVLWSVICGFYEAKR